MTDSPEQEPGLPEVAATNPGDPAAQQPCGEESGDDALQALDIACNPSDPFRRLNSSVARLRSDQEIWVEPILPGQLADESDEEDAGPERNSILGQTYRVPRRFGIGTIYIFILIFCLLIKVSLSSGVDPIAIQIMITQITFVAIAQAALFKNKQPRFASVVAGTVFLLILSLIYHFFIDQPSFFSVRNPLPLIIMVSFTLGPILGYVSGGISAGIFLVMDLVGKTLERNFPRQAPVGPQCPLDA